MGHWALNPEQNTEAAESGQSEADQIKEAANRRRNLEKTWTEQYVPKPGRTINTVPAIQTDARIEEGVAAGLFLRVEGEPDARFPGDRVIPAPGKEATAQAIIDAMGRNREQYLSDPARRAQYRREYSRVTLANVPRGMDPEAYIYQLAQRGQAEGLWKEIPGTPDGFLPGGNHESTMRTATDRKVFEDFRTAAEGVVRDAEMAKIAAERGGDPAQYGQRIAEAVERAIREGKIDLRVVYPKGKGPGAKGGPADPEKFEVRLAGGADYAGMSRIYADAMNAELGPILADATQETDFKDYLTDLVKAGKLDRLRNEGESHREELREGADTSAIDAARRRIEALNAEDARIAPKITDPAEIYRLGNARWNRNRVSGNLYTRGPRSGTYNMDAVMADALREDSVMAAEFEVQRDYQGRVNRLEAQIAATVDRAVQGQLRAQVEQLRQEELDAITVAKVRAQESVDLRAAEQAREAMMDPAERAHLQTRRAQIRAMFMDPAAQARLQQTGRWSDMTGGNTAWNTLPELAREQAGPMLNLALEARREALRNPTPAMQARAEELLQDAIATTERIRAEYGLKVEHVQAENEVNVREVADMVANGRRGAVNLGRSDSSPKLNHAMLQDMRTRLGMNALPARVNRRVGENGIRYRELVYETPSMREVAMAVRYDMKGNMLAANLLAIPGGAFRTDGRGRVTDRPTTALESQLLDPTTVWAPRRNLDQAGGTVRGTGTGGRAERNDAADWTGFGAPFASRNPDIRAGQLQRSGMSAGEAALVAGQQNRVRRPRQTGLRRYFGMN